MTPTNTLGPQLDRIQRNALVIGVIAFAVTLVGLFLNAQHFWQSYLYGYIAISALAIGSLGIFLLHNVVGGNWGVAIRRFVESGLQTLPMFALLVIPILFATGSLYKWTDATYRAEHFAVGHKAVYMNVPFFIGRTVFYFAVWMFLGWRILGMANEHDRTGDPALFKKIKGRSAPALLVFVLTTTYAFIDWIMSLEPDWYSTIYGWLFTVGEVLLTFAFMIALLVLFSKHEPFASFVKIAAFSRSRQSHALLHHALGLHGIGAIPDHLCRESAGRNSLVHSPLQRRLGLPRLVHFDLPFLRPLLSAPDAFRQEKSPAPASAGHLDHLRPHVGYILVCGARFPTERTRSLLDRPYCADRHGRYLARLFHFESEEAPHAGTE